MFARTSMFEIRELKFMVIFKYSLKYLPDQLCILRILVLQTRHVGDLIARVHVSSNV